MLKNRLCVSVLILSLLTTGCATSQDSYSVTGQNNEQVAKENFIDKNMTLIQGTAIGLGVGAGAGALIGGLTSGWDGKATTTGAIIGGTIGTLLMGAYARYIIKEKERIFAENKAIDVLKADIDARNREVEDNIVALNQNIVALNANRVKMEQNENLTREEKNKLKQEIKYYEAELKTLKDKSLVSMIELEKIKNDEAKETDFDEFVSGNAEAQIIYNYIMQNADDIEIVEENLKLVENAI